VLTAHTGAMAIVGGNIVVADSTAESVYAVPATGDAAATPLVTGLTGNLGPLVGCGNDVCLVSEVEVGPSQVGIATLQEIKSNGAVTPLVTSGDLYIAARLLFDGTTFYGTTGGDVSTGIAFSIPVGGGVASVIGQGMGIVVDDSCVYLANVSGGVVALQKESFMLAQP
jgi:hypothetical protein